MRSGVNIWREDQRKETTMRKMIMRTLALGLLALSVIVGFIVIRGCDDMSRGDGIGSRLGLIPPPISVTFRESMMTGYVLQLHNRSNNRIVANVYVENKVRNQRMKQSFGVPPNEMKEIGILESDWAFESGENGYVEADGFTQKIYFEIEDGGRYRTW